GEGVEGGFWRVEPLDVDRHAADLYAANNEDTERRQWTYLGYGPFDSLHEYVAWMRRVCSGDDPLFHAIIDSAIGQAVGVASYLRIEPATGPIEVGDINFSPRPHRTPAPAPPTHLPNPPAPSLA